MSRRCAVRDVRPRHKPTGGGPSFGSGGGGGGAGPRMAEVRPGTLGRMRVVAARHARAAAGRRPRAPHAQLRGARTTEERFWAPRGSILACKLARAAAAAAVARTCILERAGPHRTPPAAPAGTASLACAQAGSLRPRASGSGTAAGALVPWRRARQLALQCPAHQPNAHPPGPAGHAAGAPEN